MNILPSDITIEIALEKFSAFTKQHDLEIEIVDFDKENVYIDFPRETPKIAYAHRNFIEYTMELMSIVFSINSIRSKRISQYAIFSSEPMDVLFERTNFRFENKNFQIEIISNPFFIGLANVKFGFYSKYFPPCSSYYAIEIVYNDEKMNEEDEFRIIKSFIFELYQATNILLETTELYDADSDYYGDKYENNEDEHDKIRKDVCVTELLEYNDAMESYLKAADNVDDDIRFLYFYKIIEYYSPKVAKLKGYELLYKKLDTLKYKSIDNEDLNRIFEISDMFRKSKSDSELAKTVLSASIDIIDLFSLLPDSIIKLLCKNTKLNPKDISYDLAQDSIDSIFQQLGKILYSTRNNIVHAKSNYTKDGFECRNEDMNDLNNFLAKATFQIISWSNKLPKYQ